MHPQEKHPMTRTLSTITVALCLAAAGITAAQAGPITLPLVNADFNTVYKPGSTTVTATQLSGFYGYTNQMTSGASVTSSPATAQYSDGTSGTAVDIPGWVSTGIATGIQQEGAAAQFHAYSNGPDYSPGSTGGSLTQTLSGITAQPNDIFTLSADLSGPATGCPTTYRFYFAGTEIIAMNPVTWTPAMPTLFTQQYQFTGTVPTTGDLMVVVNFSAVRDQWYGTTQTQIDNVVLSVPEPAALSLLGLGALGCFGRGRRRG
ncbi:MAG: PEP-CTERM sorting domain-containing protein [Lentisphaeria bacterium]